MRYSRMAYIRRDTASSTNSLIETDCNSESARISFTVPILLHQLTVTANAEKYCFKSLRLLITELNHPLKHSFIVNYHYQIIGTKQIDNILLETLSTYGNCQSIKRVGLLHTRQNNKLFYFLDGFYNIIIQSSTTYI